MSLTADQREALVAPLSRSQELGYIGKGPLDPHIDHSLRFLPLLPAGAGRALDLGSGGGLPGLILAVARPEIEWWLVDASRRRVEDLRLALEQLGLSRVTAVHGRSEELARREDLRAAFDAVVARSFGPPAVAAECAAGFLAVGGLLVVSEPPEPLEDRWPSEPLGRLGMEPVESLPGFQVCRQEEVCPAGYPRRAGVPERKPLF